MNFTVIKSIKYKWPSSSPYSLPRPQDQPVRNCDSSHKVLGIRNKTVFKNGIICSQVMAILLNVQILTIAWVALRKGQRVVCEAGLF